MLSRTELWLAPPICERRRPRQCRRSHGPSALLKLTDVAPHDVGPHLAEDAHLRELQVLDVVVNRVPAGVGLVLAGMVDVGRKAAGLPLTPGCQ